MKGILNPKDFLEYLEYHPATGALYQDIPVQQNGIDLRVVKMEEPDLGVSRFTFKANGEEAVMSGTSSVLTNNPMRLVKGQSYQATFHLRLKKPLPRGVCAYVIGRSTFNRNSILIRSSLYDSGYVGDVGATVYSWRRAELDRFFRMAQIVFMSAETASMYNGQYGDIEKQTDSESLEKESSSKTEDKTSKIMDSIPTDLKTVQEGKPFEGLTIEDGSFEELCEDEMDDKDEEFLDVMNEDIPQIEGDENYTSIDDDELDDDEEEEEEVIPVKKPVKRRKKKRL